MVEHAAVNRRVAGSSPARGANPAKGGFNKYELEQYVVKIRSNF